MQGGQETKKFALEITTDTRDAEEEKHTNWAVMEPSASHNGG